MNFQYIDILIKNCESAKNANLIREFTLDLNNLAELDNISTAIYVVKEINGDNQVTYQHFKNYKLTKERKYPKLNSPSSIMYVGSSTTNLKKRIKEHIGEGSKSTYSLQLKHWFDKEYEITIKIYNEPKEILQIIEDNLSYVLKPAFGKKGSNNT